MPDAQLALVTKLVGRKAKLFADREFRHDLGRINQNTAKRMKTSFRQTTRTWDEVVDFHQITEVQPNPTALVYTEDEIYGYVSGGTRVRYAVMTDDFEAKTRPGALDSRPGKGGFSHFDFKNPRPGIPARNFPDLVVKKHKKAHQRDVEEAIQRALKKVEIK